MQTGQPQAGEAMQSQAGAHFVSQAASGTPIARGVETLLWNNPSDIYCRANIGLISSINKETNEKIAEVLLLSQNPMPSMGVHAD